MEKSTNMLLGIIVIIFGLIFLLAPEGVFASIVMVAGIFIISFGLLRLLGAMKEESNYKSYSIVTACIGILIGVILIVYRDTTVKVMAEILGICLLISGISSLLFMLKSNIKGKILLKPIIKIVIGIVSFLVPIVPTVVAGTMIGIILILAGVSILTTKKEEEVIYKVKIKK